MQYVRPGSDLEFYSKDLNMHMVKKTFLWYDRPESHLVRIQHAHGQKMIDSPV